MRNQNINMQATHQASEQIEQMKFAHFTDGFIKAAMDSGLSQGQAIDLLGNVLKSDKNKKTN